MVNIMGYYDEYISHHGIKGQKWGVRRFQNKDGSLTKEGKNRYGKMVLEEGDRILFKNHEFQRVFTDNDQKISKNDYKNKRLYVSDNASEYLNDYFIDDLDKTKVMTIIAKKDMVIAGEKSIDRILSKIGEEPLHKMYDENGAFNTKPGGTDRDFLKYDEKIGSKFIKEAIKEGYSGVEDPVDSYSGIGFSETARILINNKDYKIKDIKNV